jgi:hypothetical protein
MPASGIQEGGLSQGQETPSTDEDDAMSVDSENNWELSSDTSGEESGSDWERMYLHCWILVTILTIFIRHSEKRTCSVSRKKTGQTLWTKQEKRHQG